MASIDLEYNSGFQIYNANGTKFHDLVLHKCTYETVVMSLGDKISGILYYKDNALDVKMTEYIIYKGVKYTLVNPPTILKEGLVSDNGELKGMTKYSFTFYHPMYVLNNFPFSDIAVQSGQSRYLSQNKTFSWIGNLNDYVAKINKNLQGTEWFVKVGDNVTQEEKTKLSDVLSFDKNTIAEALKRGYETWEVPYIVDSIHPNEYSYIDEHNVRRDYYDDGKRFIVLFGLPTTEITVKDDNGFETPFVFKMGQGVGLKNNSRNPKNNKIITRIAGYGSEDNIPYGYPQIPYYGGNVQYPLYYGIVGGQRVQLIKHPFTRNHLMPSVYSQSVYNKVNPKLPNGSNNPNYDPTIELVDYYDANDNTYTNRIKPNSPSYEIHEFGDIKPELGEKSIISAVPVSQQEMQPDYKQKSDFLQEILDRISATEIEDEKTELLDVYDRVDAGLSYYEKHGEEGGDTYWFVFSITRDDYYEYVSYESSNYNFTATVLRNGSSAPTPDWDDTMDDDGNYLQSYFKITLPTLEFDIYACAAITQEMKINMRSGACIGCTFPVEVDWDDYKRNFYNSDGEFDPDGEQRDYTKYPDSSSGQITVMVKKELETFGTLMPNQYQQPTTGDKFVILGISLPNTYITSAEQRLDTDMKQYMRDNNVYYYDYPLKFDEHFLISHEDILSQMKNNVVVRFNYAGTEHALYIKQMSVKYNESPLPKYDITLTDDIEIVLNQIGQVTDEVSKLRLGFGAGGFGTVGAEYLRKDIDDTARGTIRMIKGMQVGERFVTGLLGEGGVFRKDSDGTTYLETDKLYVRMKAYFDTVEVKHYLHTGGNRIASQASGIVCSRVEMIDAYGGLAMDVADAVLFRCFFKANDGDKTIRNDFMIGDLAFCRETNVDVSSVNLHGYWRLVIGRNVDGFLTENKEAWIDLSNRASDTITVGGRQYSCAGYQNGSDAPIAQDDIIQLGNIANKDRQGAIVEYVGGDDAPSYQIFQGIGEDLPYPYTLEDKNYIGLGYSSQTGHAYMNVYGDVFIGAKPDAITGESPTYIKYEQEDPVTGEPKLTIKAIVEFQSPDDPQTTTTLDDFARLITGDIENIQSQIDGEIDTWFYAGIPTLQNAPANEWTTDAEKEKHTGDLYYDIGTGADAGKAYRFVRSQTTPYVYSWQYIDDTAITEALRIAAHAQDTADGKRRVFLTIPTPPYDDGDLWANAVYPANYDGRTDEGNHRYNNDLLRAKKAVPRTEDEQEITTFSINDWELASKYTDDSALLDFLDGYQGTLTTIRNQVDAKAETWYQDEDPSTLTPQEGGWYGGDDAEHVGDIWFCTKNHASPSLFKKGTTWIWQPHTTEHGVSYAWEEQEIPDEVFDKIDGKSSIYANDPNDVDSTKRHPSNYKANDVWILPMIYVNNVLNPSTYTINNITYGAGEMLTALRDNETYSAGDWAKKVRYTDDSALENFKTNQYVQLLTGGQITSDINSAKQTADNAQTAAEAAQTSADNANTKLTDWASDSYISPTEKTALKTEWEDVKTEYTQICNDADKYSIDKTAFTSAYTSANAAFQKYTAATPENITVGSDYQNIKDYYAARQTILNAISDAAKTLAQNAATAYMSDTALNAIKYALNGGSTTQDGGLILSNIIALRDANENVMSGMNGVYNSQLTSGGIAAWYGGAMTDHEQSPSALNYAKSLFRFDGSGYLAGGNITWTKDGQVTISDLYTMISGESDFQTDVLNKATLFSNLFHTSTTGTEVGTLTRILPQAAFRYIDIDHDSNYTFTNSSVLNYGEMKARFVPLEFFNALFTAYSDANHANAINPWTWTDTAAASRAAINNLKVLVGTWTEQYLSALGHNSQQGGGGGIGDVTWEALASAGNQQINISHLSSADVATQSWVRSQFGSSVVRVDVGTDKYFPTGGVVSLPAYPTTLPASDVSDWAKAATKPTYAFSEITGSLTVADIPSLPWSKITTGKPTSWWGVSTIANDGSVSGDMSSVGDISFSASGKNIGGLLYFDTTNKYVGVGITAPTVSLEVGHADAYNTTSIPTVAKFYNTTPFNTPNAMIGAGADIRVGISDAKCIIFRYTGTTVWANACKCSIISVGASGGTEAITIGEYGTNVGIGNTNPQYKLHVGGYTKTTRLYLSDSIYLEVANNAVHVVGGGLYADTYISALGDNSSGGGGIGDVTWDALANPTMSGQQQIDVTHIATALGSYGTATQSWVNSQGFLRADGSVIASKLGIGINSTSPTVKLDVAHINAYNTTSIETIAHFYNATPSNTANAMIGAGADIRIGFADAKCMILRYTGTNAWANAGKGSIISGGTEAITISEYGTNVGIGNTNPQYRLHVGGIGYFTGKVYSEGNEVLTSYTDTKNTAGTSAYSGSSDKLYIVCGESMSSYVQTYANAKCYIKGDELYSNNAKVATGTIPTNVSQLTNDSGYVTTDTKTTAGTTQSSSKLYLVGSTTSVSTANSYNTTNTNENCYIGTDSCVYSNGSQTLTQDGSVIATKLGIGGSAPTVSLEVGHTNARNTTSIETVAHFYNTTPFNTASAMIGTGADIRVGIDSGKCIILRYTGTNAWANTGKGSIISGGTEAITISEYGTNVGIGTTSPSYKLHVNGYTKTTRLYLSDSIYLEVANNGVHIVGGGLYADTYVSAFGANTSSGGGGGNYVTTDGEDQLITAAKIFNKTVQINNKLTVNSSIQAIGGFFSSQGSISCRHDITGGGNLSMNGTATIAGTATIGGYMTIGATEAVGTVNSAVIQTLNSRAIYIKTDNAPNYVDGTWSSTSDIRLKDIINNVGASVDQIANAPIFNYKWKAGGVSIMLGSSAQYWQKVFQHAVEIGPENYLYMDYSSVALASAVMVARKVQNHEDRILELERENEQLRNEIKQLKAA